MPERRLTARQADDPAAPPRCQETVMDGWTVTEKGGGEKRGEGGAVLKTGEGRCC